MIRGDVKTVFLGVLAVVIATFVLRIINRGGAGLTLS